MKLLLSCLFVLVIYVEAVLRFFDPYGFSYYRDTAKYHHDILIADNHTVYRQRPNAFTQLEEFSIKTNSIGARWQEYPAQIGLLILGDSVVLGWGVPIDSTFMAQIGADAVMGVGSWNSQTETQWFLRSGLLPKTLLWIITSNDIEVKQPFAPADWHSWFYRNLVSTSLYWHTKQQERRQSNAQFINTDEWHSAVASMVMYCQTEGIKLVPVFYGIDDDVFGAYRSAFQAFGASTLARFPSEVYEHRISRIDGHPDATGHRLMAEFIRKVLHVGNCR